MSGMWSFKENSNSRLLFTINTKKNDKTYKLYFSDVRNFGTVIITNNENELNKKIDKLGVDLIKSGFSDDDMVKHIKDFCITSF